jgi:hypothetical protein
LINVSPPIGGEGEGEIWRDVDDRDRFKSAFWRGLNGAERSSGYVWKNKGAKVVPKNAPGCQRQLVRSRICQERQDSPSTEEYLLLGGV